MTTLDLPLELNLEAVHFTDEQFYQLCIHNPEMAIEQNAQGVLIVMLPVGGESGNQEMELAVNCTSGSKPSLVKCLAPQRFLSCRLAASDGQRPARRAIARCRLGSIIP